MKIMKIIVLVTAAAAALITAGTAISGRRKRV